MRARWLPRARLWEVLVIWVVRHAPVLVKGQCYGQSNVPVAVPHDEAAKLVVSRLSALDVPIRRITTSPWERAQGLAEALAKQLGLPLRVDARLSELSFGEWEGRMFAEIEGSDAQRFAAWMADYTVVRPPGGETVDDLKRRVESLVHEPSVDGTLWVTHAGVIRELRRRAKVGAGGVATTESEMTFPVEHLTPERWPPP
jgi:alpha-ribazole phosphatase